jgi:hypothetical protein
MPPDTRLLATKLRYLLIAQDAWSDAKFSTSRREIFFRGVERLELASGAQLDGARAVACAMALSLWETERLGRRGKRTVTASVVASLSPDC